MKDIKFDPNGERLSVSFVFEGLIVASYSFTLWEAESNHRLMYEQGNNQNSDDDKYDLPMPVSSNNGRLIQLRTDFVGLDPANSKDYSITAQVFQGGIDLGNESENGSITGKTQESLIYILLKST
jgi:hypothetical protein